MKEKDFIKLNTLHAIMREAKTIQKYLNRIKGIAKDLQGDLNALQDEYRVGFIDAFEYTYKVSLLSQEHVKGRDGVLEELNKFLESVCIEAEIG